MASTIIEDERIQPLSDRDVQDGEYVLYWMQQSQRAEHNHALEYAIQRANALGQRLLVVFGLTDNYPEANLRHYTFMIEGLRETQATLAERGVKMVVRHGDPVEVALDAGRRASLIVCDCGYLRHQKAWRKKVAERADCPVIQVESDVVVPLKAVSDKAEFAARTIRPKIREHLDDYLVEGQAIPLNNPSLSLRVDGLDLNHLDVVLSKLKMDRRVGPVSHFKGGTSQAKRMLREFILDRLNRYEEHSNQPQTDDVSHMSMYLHFGQISPLYVALQVRNAESALQKNKETFLEELLVRRELAINFVHYTRDYDSFNCLPNWAKRTLEEHKADRRESVYTRAQLESSETHDEYWNAAMREMKHTGYMHNYMRMYWGKKILEWSSTPEYAFETALALNNQYFIDGRDPNSYANIAWIFGLHDRPWKERPIFGKIRYMSASGLERKCDMRAYVEKVEQLTRETDE